MAGEWSSVRLQTAPRTVVNARKPRHGTRPAPIVGLPERVAYRAIVDFLLADELPIARSRDDYLNFIRGPVDYVMQKESGIRQIALLLDDDEVKYVVKSDLSAFYEYIDHGLLGRALVGRIRSTEAAEHLMELLAELEGRSYGLPQMLDASDRLSEVYAQLIEDQLARRGYLVWRFNDDFRIGVQTFESALDAIEALAEEARSLGLIINEHKTVTPKFETYALATFGLSNVEDEIPSDEEDEVEAAVADYTEMFGDPGDAVALLAQAIGNEGDWDLGDVSQEQVGQLRRAIWSVVRARDARALPAVVPLAVYIPSLTPAICRYGEALSDGHREAVADVVDVVLARVSLGGWQRLWFNRLLRDAELLAEESPGDRTSRVAFARACTNDPRHPATRAEAALALAPVGMFPVSEIAERLVTEPRALASWYVVASHEAAQTDRDAKILRGISGSDPLYSMLLAALS